MATRYAVGSGNWSNTTTVWSDTDGGSAGSFVPVDGDTFVISAGVSVLMETDQSGMTNGMAGNNIIRGGVTPGMLYFANGTNGYLKLSTTGYISGTTSTNRGRLLANSDGTWTTTTPLQSSNTAIIEANKNSTPAVMDCQNLDVRLRATPLTDTWVQAYGSRYEVTCATDVDTTSDEIDTGGTSPANSIDVRLYPTSGSTLPSPLNPYTMYYCRSRVGNECKLAAVNATKCQEDITTTGTGSFYVYTEVAVSTTVVNVMEDMTSEWAVGDTIAIVDVGNTSADQQISTISAISSTTITLNHDIDSGQYAGTRLYNMTRNVRIKSAVASNVYLMQYGGADTHGGVWNCEIGRTAAVDVATRTGYVVYYGDGHTFGDGGSIWGFYQGARFVDATIADGFVIACCNIAFGGTTSHNTFTMEDGAHIIGSSSYAFDAPGASSSIGGQIIGCATAINNGVSGLTTTSTFRVVGGNTAFNNVPFSSSSGGAIHSAATGFNGPDFLDMSGTWLIEGCTTGITQMENGYIGSGVSIRGVSTAVAGSGGVRCEASIWGVANYGVHLYSESIFSGTMEDVQNAFYLVQSGAIVSGATLTDIYMLLGTGGTPSTTTLMGCTFTNIFSYEGFSVSGAAPMILSHQHGGTANNTQGFSYQCTLTHETTEKPVGESFSHKLTFTAAKKTTIIWRIDRPTHEAISIPVHAKHDSTGLSADERITWSLFTGDSDPRAGGTAKSTWTATDSTSWQSSTLSHTKTDDTPVFLMCEATRASGNAYILAEVPDYGVGGPSGLFNPFGGLVQ